MRIENEKYFRAHPELHYMLQNFIWKCIDDRPKNILEYAGTYFDRAELHDVVKVAAEKQKELEP